MVISTRTRLLKPPIPHPPFIYPVRTIKNPLLQSPLRGLQVLVGHVRSRTARCYDTVEGHAAYTGRGLLDSGDGRLGLRRWVAGLRGKVSKMHFPSTMRPIGAYYALQCTDQ